MGVVLQRALELVDQCDCTSDRGCPACVQHTNCDEYNAVLNKEGAKIVLKHVLNHEVTPLPQENTRGSSMAAEPLQVKVKVEEL